MSGSRSREGSGNIFGPLFLCASCFLCPLPLSSPTCLPLSHTPVPPQPSAPPPPPVLGVLVHDGGLELHVFENGPHSDDLLTLLQAAHFQNLGN